MASADNAKGLEFKVVFVVGATDGQFVPRDDWTLEGGELNNYRPDAVDLSAASP